jgi:hypothetical protein
MINVSKVLALFLLLLSPIIVKPKDIKEKTRVLTLSNGRYEEFFDQDSIERIGSLLYNVNSEKVIGFVDDAADKTLKPEIISRWLSIDPLASKYPSISPYVFCNNNPIRNLDPDGRKFLDFNQNGDFIGVSHNNFFHNLFFRQGRMLDNKGEVLRQFRFADRKNDIRDIENGVIKKLVLVNEKQLKTMVAWSGGFDKENKTANRSSDRYGYIRQEGQGGGRMDFSYTQIPKMFPGASEDPLREPSSMIFLPPSTNKTERGTAHNQMNFGNYLFGLSGQAQGFSGFELSAGGHYNSLENSTTNGYDGQLDSKDDQYSIQQGYNFGLQRGWDKIEYKVQAGKMQLSSPPNGDQRAIK